MALKLTRVGPGEFTGKKGDEFEVDVVPDGGGGPFLITAVCYAGVCLNDPPFKFTIVQGNKALSAVYDWDREGEWVRLLEIDGAEKQTLAKKRYKEAEPKHGVLIVGT